MSPDPPWRMNRRAPATRQSGPMTATASRTRQPEVLTPEERVAHGKEARKRVPLEMHAEYAPPRDRLDPVALLEGQAMTRVPDLVPLRYGRMLVSPFTFYRGAALVMAADLAATPISGFRAQLCGDAHLSNFGLFATPERRMIFDVNDFDETLPGPWEWDVKRLVASLAVAGRENGYSRKERRRVVHGGRRGVPQGDAGVRRLHQPRRLLRQRRPGLLAAAVGWHPDPQAASTHRGEHRQGPHPRLHAGARQADRARRRASAASSATHPSLVPIEALFPEQLGA